MILKKWKECLNEYLEFSRHQKSEETEIINLEYLIQKIKKYDQSN